MARPRIDRKKIGSNNKKRGASEERAVAALLTDKMEEPFKRVGNRGASSADVESDNYVVEVKSRTQASPLLMREAQEQLEKAMAETGKDGFLVFRYKDNGKRTTWVIKKVD